MNANEIRLQRLKEMERQQPDDPFLKFAIAQEYQALGNMDEVRNLYAMLLEKHPDYVPTYYHAAKLKEAENNLHEAAQIYKKGIEIASRAADHHALRELKAALFELEA